MEFRPGWPALAIGFGLIGLALATFGALVLILFVRSLIAGQPGLAVPDLIVAIGAAVVIPVIIAVSQWIAMRQVRAFAQHQMNYARSGFAHTEAIRFDTFDEEARRTLTLAQDEAAQLGHHYIGTEHLLLGLVRDRDVVAGRALSGLGVELDKVRMAVRSIIGSGPQAPSGEIGLTPRAKRVIELAIDESRQLEDDFIGTGHLLLGLVREGEGVAAGVLESLGVTLDRARFAVLREMGKSET